MNKQQAIEQVNASVGSLFSKSDVLAIINSLETAPASTDAKTSELIEKMRTKICSVFAQMKNDAGNANVDSDDATFEIDYNNRVCISNEDDLSVEINGSSAEDWVAEYQDEMETFLDKLEEETKQETEEQTEQETEEETEI